MTQSREKAFQAFVDTALRGASEEELRDARRHFCAGFTMGYMLKPEPALTEDEWFALYGSPLDYGQRFILNRLGYVRDWVGFKFRGATKSRMAFAMMRLDYD